MKGGIGQLMKQAQQMQEDMKKAQEELSNITITGESGGGMVSVIMTCKHEIKALNIDNALLSDDKDMLEDLIIAAFNDSIRKVEKKSQEQLSGMTSVLNLPPGMKLPF
jgi:DNA-binding YbaB/EbfC family protein